jgi:hypothetical protein
MRETWPDTGRTLTMTPRLIRFTQRARAESTCRFNALMGLLYDPQGLHASFERQDGTKAPGVVSRTVVEDSGWEPNGVTHPARFYEGGGTYPLRGFPPLLSKSARYVLWESEAGDSL